MFIVITPYEEPSTGRQRYAWSVETNDFRGEGDCYTYPQALREATEHALDWVETWR